MPAGTTSLGERLLQAVLVTILIATAAACGGDGDDNPPGPPSFTAPPLLSPSPRSWRTLTPMPTPRSEVAVAELNRKIYVIGGFEEDGSPSDKVEAYDPATDSWSEAAPLPEPRHHAAAFVFGTLVVVGGYEQGFDDPQSTIFQYNSALDSWSELNSLPRPRGGLGAADLLCDEQQFLGACVYIIGGSDAEGRNIAAVDLNDPNGVWMEGASLPTPRDHLAVVEADQRIYAIGGRRDTDFGRNLDANEMYDRHTNVWTSLAPLPTPRSGIAAAELDGRIYVFGGEGPTGTFSQNEAYDPATNTWETMPPMPTARHGLGAAVVDGTIYVIGGGRTPGGSVSDLNEAFTP
jgi:N-acetylneuraminic acid mutarotase